MLKKQEKIGTGHPVNETRQKSCVGLDKLKRDQETPEANNIIV